MQTFDKLCLRGLPGFVFLVEKRVVKTPSIMRETQPSTTTLFVEQLGYYGAFHAQNYALLPSGIMRVIAIMKGVLLTCSSLRFSGFEMPSRGVISPTNRNPTSSGHVHVEIRLLLCLEPLLGLSALLPGAEKKERPTSEIMNDTHHNTPI